MVVISLILISFWGFLRVLCKDPVGPQSEECKNFQNCKLWSKENPNYISEMLKRCLGIIYTLHWHFVITLDFLSTNQALER